MHDVKALAKFGITISKVLLSLQGLILIYPSLLAVVIFIFGSTIPFLFGSFQADHIEEFILGMILLIFLISAWRVYFWVLLNGPKNKKHISNTWTVLCLCAFILSIVSYFVFTYIENKSSDNFLYMNSQFFMYGLFFVPTGIHVALDWLWQNKLKSKNQ